MEKSQLTGVEHQTRGAEGGGVIPDVNALSDQGKTSLGQVNSDLMGAARLELAIDEGRAIELLQRCHVGDGQLALSRQLGGAPDAIATIGDEPGAEGPWLVQAPVDEGAVAAVGGVIPELLGEVLLGGQREGEDKQPRGLLVEAVHHAHPPLGTPPAGAALAAEQRADQLVQRAGLALIERDGADASGLLHHHHVPVQVGDHLAPQPLLRRGPGGVLPQLDPVSGGDQVPVVLHPAVVAPDLPGGHQPARVAPAQPREQRPQDAIDGLPGDPRRDLVLAVSRPPGGAHFIAIFAANPPITGIFQALPWNALNAASSQSNPKGKNSRLNAPDTYTSSVSLLSIEAIAAGIETIVESTPPMTAMNSHWKAWNRTKRCSLGSMKM